MNINILGTDVDVTLIHREDDSRFAKDLEISGLSDFSVNKIKVLNHLSDSVESDDALMEDLVAVEKRVLLHEIAHMSLFLSGLDDQSRNEQLCDWLSIQIPKMMKAWEEGCRIIDNTHAQEMLKGILDSKDAKRKKGKIKDEQQSRSVDTDIEKP